MLTKNTDPNQPPADKGNMTVLKMKELLERYESHIVLFRNLTSRTEVAGAQLTGLSSKGCSLNMPANCCATGHQVLMRIELRVGSREIMKLEVTGSIQEVNNIGPKTAEVNVLLVQFLKEEWQKLLGYYEAKQDEINDLVQKLKEQ